MGSNRRHLEPSAISKSKQKPQWSKKSNHPEFDAHKQRDDNQTSWPIAQTQTVLFAIAVELGFKTTT
jgi:hypothetical protein